MTEWKSETTTAGLRELDTAELEIVSGGLNPQPLPPRATFFRSSLSFRALNPQPEPPGVELSRLRVF